MGWHNLGIDIISSFFIYVMRTNLLTNAIDESVGVQTVSYTVRRTVVTAGHVNGRGG